MTDNSNNGEARNEMMRMSNEYFNATASANYQHLLPPPQYFTQQMYYPYINPYSHLTEANGNLAIHGYGSDGRPKFRRSRTIFNPEQLDVLEHHFENYKYPDVKRRKMISEEIGLPEERIQIWFQNRRAKDKRQIEQQDKLQKLVDEAIGGTQEVNKIQSNEECVPSTSFHIQTQRLSELQCVKMGENETKIEPEASCSKQNNNIEYINSPCVAFPDTSEEAVMDKANENTASSQNMWPNGGMELATPQVSIQNIDQDLLFKVANILSASNDAAQLITQWSQSPNKLQTNSLEEQLRHFAEHHHKVLTDNGNMNTSISSINIPHGGLENDQ